MWYGIYGGLMCKKEFLKNNTSITDDFKLGYFEEYMEVPAEMAAGGKAQLINNGISYIL